MTATWIATGFFFVLTVLCFMRVNDLYHHMDAGPRVRRLKSQRMMATVGLWQLSLAAVMIVSPELGWTNALSVGFCGLLILGSVRFWRRFNLPA